MTRSTRCEAALRAALGTIIEHASPAVVRQVRAALADARRAGRASETPDASPSGAGHADAYSEDGSTDARSPNPSIPAGSGEESKTP